MLSPRVRATAAALLIGGAFWMTGPTARAQEPTFPAAKGPADAGEPPPVPGTELTPPGASGGVVVESRGPVHEAFARPADMAPPPGPVVARQPPQAVPEVPPDQKPEGEGIAWIPGYWAWDGDRKDFLWVSGVWRKAPPGRKWVPGNWNEVEGGWQWTPGFWAPNSADALPFLPEPPQSIDNGPSSPAPDEDSFYVPGCWLYRDQGYAWRPGYWTACRQGWVWTPPCYSWTPSGFLFVDGFWDYPLEGRGLLFAPVCFNGTPWLTPGWAFCPSYCVPSASLCSCLFAGPGGGGFYFGNYFGSVWAGRGFRPWIAAGFRSPLFGYYSWAYRGNPAWLGGLRAAYAGVGVGQLGVVRPLTAAGAGVSLTHLTAAQVGVHHRQAVGLQEWSARARAWHAGGRPAFASAGASAHAAAHAGWVGGPHVRAAAGASGGAVGAWGPRFGHPGYGVDAHAAAAAHARVNGGRPPSAAGASAHAGAAAAVGAHVTHHPHHSDPPPAHHAAPPSHHAPPPAHHKAPAHGGGGHHHP
jgi:hypothetical protein